ncbi:hypothetical protein HYS91_01870, partial [Candidatus Daviesbacteria bacterium]|nr:hypothetical protein [Candidatus Daviesbacteria bacterium]
LEKFTLTYGGEIPSEINSELKQELIKETTKENIVEEAGNSAKLADVI